MKVRILLILSMLSFFSCTVETETRVGPNGSWWLGGDDGGVFVSIQDDGKPNDSLYQGTIYFDGNQKVWYKGGFKLVGKLQFHPENRDQYQFWDGEKLHLLESSYLEPTQPIPPL